MVAQRGEAAAEICAAGGGVYQGSQDVVSQPGGISGGNGAGGFPSGDAGNHQQDAGELSGAGSIAIVAVRQIF